MAKPRLEKVRALFYVLQHIQEGASNFDTPSRLSSLRPPTSLTCRNRSMPAPLTKDNISASPTTSIWLPTKAASSP